MTRIIITDAAEVERIRNFAAGLSNIHPKARAEIVESLDDLLAEALPGPGTDWAENGGPRYIANIRADDDGTIEIAVEHPDGSLDYVDPAEFRERFTVAPSPEESDHA